MIFLLREFSPFSLREVSEGKGGLLNAGKFADGEAHRVAETAQFPLLSLFEGDFQERLLGFCGEDADIIRLEEVSCVMDSAEHHPLDFGCEASLAENHIDFGHLIGGMREFLDEVAVIGE